MRGGMSPYRQRCTKQRMLNSFLGEAFLAIVKRRLGLRALSQFRVVSLVYEVVDLCPHLYETIEVTGTILICLIIM